MRDGLRRFLSHVENAFPQQCLLIIVPPQEITKASITLLMRWREIFKEKPDHFGSGLILENGESSKKSWNSIEESR